MYDYTIKNNHAVEAVCRMCGITETIEVGEKGLERLKEGNLLIQRAIPQVSPELREMLISGTCPACCKEMFASFEDEDDDY